MEKYLIIIVIIELVECNYSEEESILFKNLSKIP